MKKLHILLLASCALLASAAFAFEKPLGTLGQGGSWLFANGAEFPGAVGNLGYKISDGLPVGVISYDFTKGGQYVTALTWTKFGPEVSELRFRVKSDKPVRVSVRLRDSSKQVHQFHLNYNTVGEWQILRLPIAKLPKHEYFSGNNDGVIAFPVDEFCILAAPPRYSSNPEEKFGELLFGDVRVIGN